MRLHHLDIHLFIMVSSLYQYLFWHNDSTSTSNNFNLVIIQRGVLSKVGDGWFMVCFDLGGHRIVFTI